MCGAALATQGTAAKNEAPPEKETRVRQATYGDGGQLTETAQQIRQQTTTIDAEPTGNISPDDPLSAFVTEVEEESEMVSEMVAPDTHQDEILPENSDNDGDNEDDFEIDEDGMVILKEKDDHHAAKGIDAAPKAEKVNFSTKSPMLSPWPAEGMKAAVQSRTTPPVAKVQVAPPPPPPPPKREEPIFDPPEEEYVPEPTPPPAPVKPKVAPPAPKVVAPPAAVVKAVEPPVQEKPKNQKPKEPVKTESGDRTLCGWFVDLTKLGGVGIELREGRFFITQQQLKDLDLVIDEPSISTPHALLSVSAAKGVKIHDLMSEHGIFVCRHGENDFESATEAVELAHGDRVKFGSVEFVLCMIARP
jgi:hypothetical protein